MDANSAIIDRLERIVASLQDNSIKMGQLLAVHQEKLDKQEKADDILFQKIEHIHKDLHEKTDEIKKGCERDIMLVDGRIRELEKKLWSIAGAFAVLTFMVSDAGIRILKPILTPAPVSASIQAETKLPR